MEHDIDTRSFYRQQPGTSLKMWLWLGLGFFTLLNLVLIYLLLNPRAEMPGNPIGKIVLISGKTSAIGTAEIYEAGSAIAIRPLSGQNPKLVRYPLPENSFRVIAENRADLAKRYPLPAPKIEEPEAAPAEPVPAVSDSGDNARAAQPENVLRPTESDLERAARDPILEAANSNPAPGADPAEQQREEGLKVFVQDLQIVQRNIAKVESLWKTYNQYCIGNNPSTRSLRNTNDGWKHLPPRSPSDKINQCTNMSDEINALAQTIRSGQEKAVNKARRSGCLPGDLRAILKQAGLDEE